jgi:hypothetical protein
MGLIAMYNGLDVLQSRYFIKIYVKTWLAMTLQPYFETWLDIPDTKHPVPLGTSKSFLKRLYTAKGDPSTAAQLALEKSMGFKYRKGVGQLIWPMSTSSKLHREVPAQQKLITWVYALSSITLPPLWMMASISGGLKL